MAIPIFPVDGSHTPPKTCRYICHSLASNHIRWVVADLPIWFGSIPFNISGLLPITSQSMLVIPLYFQISFHKKSGFIQFLILESTTFVTSQLYEFANVFVSKRPSYRKVTFLSNHMGIEMGVAVVMVLAQ